MSILGECAKCGSPAPNQCARCQTYYCSTMCQQGDWSTHKLGCRNDTQTRVTNRISQHIIRQIGGNLRDLGPYAQVTIRDSVRYIYLSREDTIALISAGKDVRVGGTTTRLDACTDTNFFPTGTALGPWCRVMMSYDDTEAIYYISRGEKKDTQPDAIHVIQPYDGPYA